MRAILLSLILNLLFSTNVIAQSSITSSPSVAPTSFVSLTPAMSASSVSSFFASLATTTPEQSGGDASGEGGTDGGASGSSDGSFELSKGGIIAIIICVTMVVMVGIGSSVLWYLAKKRSWEVRKTIRRSAKRVVTALTPRRTTFPKDVMSQGSRRSSRGLTKIEEVPPTPKLQRFAGFDEEKGGTKLSSIEMSDAPKHSKWTKGHKFGR